jgi:hypothetical protein
MTSSQTGMSLLAARNLLAMLGRAAGILPQSRDL